MAAPGIRLVRARPRLSLARVYRAVEEEGLLDRAEQVGKQIRARWEEVAGDLEQIGEVRGVGAMIGVEFVEDRASKTPNKHAVSEITAGSTQRGVVSVSCGIYKNVLRHLVPLVISDEQLAEGLDVLADTAAAVATG